MATTKIYVILDKSGSMENCRTDTIDGFNLFVSKQMEEKSDSVYLSLILFSNIYEIHYESKRLEDVQKLTWQTFVPYGTTALLDAIGRTVNEIQQWEGENIIVVIITDGEENSSSRYSKSQVNDLIGEKKAKGWEFVFLGANQDAIQEAGKLGIGCDSALTFSTSESKVAFDCLSEAITRSRSTPIGGSRSIHFTPQERTLSIDSPN